MFYMMIIYENRNLYTQNDENGLKSPLYDVIMPPKSLFRKINFGKNFRKKISNMIGYVIFFSF